MSNTTNQIVLNPSPKYFKMVKRLSEVYGLTIEQYILRSLEGRLRSDLNDCEHAGIGIDFTDHDLIEVIDEILDEIKSARCSVASGGKP